MRAKLRVISVTPFTLVDGTKQSETVKFSAVCAPFDAEGKSEDNTFARYTPTADLTINVANPDLFGKHEVGQTYYVDFTPADAAASEAETQPAN